MASSSRSPALEGRIRLIPRVKSSLPVFEVGPKEPYGNVVLIPGLTDGPLSLLYTHQLAETLNCYGQDEHTKIGEVCQPFRLLMPTLSSSYLGFGVSSSSRMSRRSTPSSIPSDGGEKKQSLVLIGHAPAVKTCEVHARRANAKYVSGVIFQAPVSDREGMELEHGKERSRSERICAS